MRKIIFLALILSSTTLSAQRLKSSNGSTVGYIENGRVKGSNGSTIGYIEDGRVKTVAALQLVILMKSESKTHLDQR